MFSQEIRGFGAEKCTDGYPCNRFCAGEREGLVNVERIEVLKGPNAILAPSPFTRPVLAGCLGSRWTPTMSKVAFAKHLTLCQSKLRPLRYILYARMSPRWNFEAERILAGSTAPPVGRGGQIDGASREHALAPAVHSGLIFG